MHFIKHYIKQHKIIELKEQAHISQESYFKNLYINLSHRKATYKQTILGQFRYKQMLTSCTNWSKNAANTLFYHLFKGLLAHPEFLISQISQSPTFLAKQPKLLPDSRSRQVIINLFYQMSTKINEQGCLSYASHEQEPDVLTNFRLHPQQPINFSVLDALFAQFGKKIDKFDIKVDKLDKKVGDLDQKFGDLNEKVSDLDQKVGNLNQKVDGLSLKVESIQIRIEKREKFEDQRFERLHNNLEEVKRHLDQGFQKLTHDVSLLNYAMNQKGLQLNQKFTRIQDQIVALKRSVKWLQGELRYWQRKREMTQSNRTYGAQLMNKRHNIQQIELKLEGVVREVQALKKRDQKDKIKPK